VKPNYTACRVFRWRCCGTLHLTQSVSKLDARNIIISVINNLSVVYSPENMQFGQKITYMDVIDTVIQSDSRIRYFDAGMGSNKLIEYDVPESSTNYFNTEAYFNPESIMQYVQTVEEVLDDETSKYFNMITIDPAYIQK
jgi:ribulose bisphosphate carboxylase small subunit